MTTTPIPDFEELHGTACPLCGVAGVPLDEYHPNMLRCPTVACGNINGWYPTDFRALAETLAREKAEMVIEVEALRAECASKSDQINMLHRVANEKAIAIVRAEKAEAKAETLAREKAELVEKVRGLEDSRTRMDAVAKDNIQNSWAALRMIREALEGTLPGILPSEEAVTMLTGPEPVHEAEHLVAAIQQLAARALSPEPTGDDNG